MEEEIKIPGQPNTDMTQTNEILYGILSLLESMVAKDKEVVDDVMQISYPADGTHATLAAGVTELDYDAGTIKTPAGVVSRMSSSLRKTGKPYMQSVAMKADGNIVVQFDSHDKFPVDAAEWYQATNQEFNRIRITVTADTGFYVMSSSAA